MTNVIITHDEAITRLREAVASRGNDYTYPHSYCSYVRDDEASCGVGVALHAAGVSLEALTALDHAAPSVFSGSDAGSVSIIAEDARDTLASHDVTITLDAQRVLQHFQAVQDNRGTWIAALTAAEQEHVSVTRIVADERDA